MASPPPRTPVPRLADLPKVLWTRRLRLRPLELGDVDDLWPHASDPEIARTVSWATHQDRAETVAFVEAQQAALARETDVVLAIVHEDHVIGCIGLHGITWELRAWRVDRAELGYWIARDRWGQGFATEAATELTRWAFEELGLHKLTIGCIATNDGSRRVIEKLGFRFLARHEEAMWRDGSWQDQLRYELTVAEWAELTTRTLRFQRPPQ